MSATRLKYVTSNMSVTSVLSLLPVLLRWRWKGLTIPITIILCLYLLWGSTRFSFGVYRTIIDSSGNIQASGKGTKLATSPYSYFDSRYQPISVNARYEFYYENSLSEHRWFSRKSRLLRASQMGNESVRSSNISDNADTPFMYPMLAPVHYVRYESSSLESSMQTPPRFSSCSSLLRRDAHEYTAIIRDSINFYDYPKYNMPWYFKTNQESWIESTSSNGDGAAKGQTSSGIRNSSRGTDSVYNSSDGILVVNNSIEGTLSSTVSDSDDQVYHSTMPLCGRTLVRFLENPAPGVPKHFSYNRKGRKYTRYLPKRSNGGVSVPLRNPTDLLFSKATVWEKEEPIPMKAKSLEEYYKEPVEHQFSVHRVVLRDNNEQAVSINGSGSCSVSRMGHPSEQFARVFATANTFFSQRIYIENCGGSGREEKDIFIHARLIGNDRVLAAEVVPVSTDGGSAVTSHLQYDVQFQVPDILSSSPSGPCHPYYLEIKYVHINGRSNNPRKPYTLGVGGFCLSRKKYWYNIQCDFQRHVYGSPLLIEVVKGNTTEKRSTSKEQNRDGNTVGAKCTQNITNSSFVSSTAPLISVTEHRQCTRADHTEGQWVRFQDSYSQSDVLAASHWCQSKDNSRFCSGNPVWVTDAAGYNSGMLWAPRGCAYTYWTPPQGPTESCVRLRGGRKGTLLLVGDSLIRELHEHCEEFNLSKANLVCMYWRGLLRGYAYTRTYAKRKVNNIISVLVKKKPAVFATNLGIHHMLGPVSTAQWMEFVNLFASEWEDKINRGVFRVNSACNDTLSRQNLTNSVNTFIIEKAIWITSPTIHYGNRGLSYQRAVTFNQIAISRLRPLGFDHLNAFAPTYSRQEASSDGLHYSAEKGHPSVHLMNPLSEIREHNGGVCSMIFTMLLNLICFG